MYLQRLHVQHVRNLHTQSLSLSPGFNYFYGPNGAGKTAVLEAVYWLARGRSFRNARVTSLIQHDTDEALVRGELVSHTLPSTLTLALAKQRGGDTRIRINGEASSKVSALAKHLPIQAILPSASELLFAGPGVRRSFVDWGMFHVEQHFLNLSRDYRRALSQRNAWLKQNPAAREVDDPWRQVFLESAVALNQSRQSYVEELDGYFQRHLSELGLDLNVSLEYQWGGLSSPEDSAKKMSESFARDVKFGLTHRGPHRSDCRFSVDGKPAGEVLSRGQAKVVASAAILAQATMLDHRNQTSSVFLIDDLGAELDADHWQRFLHALVKLGGQILATSTFPPGEGDVWERILADFDKCRVFHVKHGLCTEAA